MNKLFVIMAAFRCGCMACEMWHKQKTNSTAIFLCVHHRWSVPICHVRLVTLPATAHTFGKRTALNSSSEHMPCDLNSTDERVFSSLISSRDICSGFLVAISTWHLKRLCTAIHSARDGEKHRLDWHRHANYSKWVSCVRGFPAHAWAWYTY